MRYLAKYLKPYRLQFIIGPAFKLLEAVLELFMPIMMALIIDKGIPAGDTGYILAVGGLMLLTASVGLGSAVICQYSASVASQGFGTAVRNALFKKVLSLSYAQVDKYGVQTLSNRITNDVTQLQTAVAMTIRLVIRAPFICIGSVVATLLIDWKLGLVVVCALPLFAAALFLVMRKSSPMYTKVQEGLDDMSDTLRENLSGVRVIRAFAREDAEKERFAGRNRELLDRTLAVGRVSTLLNPVTNLIMNFSIIAIIWFGGIRVDAGDLSQGQILAFISYVTQMLSVLIVVANLVVLFTRAFASLRRVNEIFALEDDPSEKEAGGPANRIPAPAVEFKDVSFAYPGGGEEALSHISFTLPAGETLGIIGATGAGKSTLAALIGRFYTPTAGQVLVEGRPVEDYGAADLRGRIGLVPQRVELFAGTVADNLRLGAPDAPENLLESAAKTAQAYAFIERLPEDFNAPVRKGGANFSGGQRQRLAIARALVKQPAVLILDDAASALDYATDAALRQALRRDCKGMTTVIISQRVWAVQNCHQILVLEDGAVAGLGSHAQLMESCPAYREIALSQSDGKEVSHA
ncbi:MAG TPA: ABC transporter ATP-binding protein/permease [Firmicutes bacterium]|nr:ABC transporter ATP-binding protein/permease [Bacillota bacterium]